jgi:hypothetical protein
MRDHVLQSARVEQQMARATDLGLPKEKPKRGSRPVADEQPDGPAQAIVERRARARRPRSGRHL